MKYEFDAVLHEEDDGGTYVIFPWDVRELTGKGRMKVHAEFCGIPYDGSIVNMGVKDEQGKICWVIGVRRDIRRKLGVKNGSILHVIIQNRQDVL